MVDEYSPFTAMGWMLILLGVIFVALPYISRLVPSIDRVPCFILYVYRRDGFYFATSPLLILLSLVSFLYHRSR